MAFESRVVLHLTEGDGNCGDLHNCLLREGYRVSYCRRPELLPHWLRVRRFSVIVGEDLAMGSSSLLCAELTAVPTLPVLLYRSSHRPSPRGIERIAGVVLEASVSVEIAIAHLRALLRRADGYPPHLSIGPVCVDLARGRASVAGKPLALRPKELELLAHLVQAGGEPLAPGMLSRCLWSDYAPTMNRLKVLISNLRRRLRRSPLSGRDPIEYVPGSDYRLNPSLCQALFDRRKEHASHTPRGSDDGMCG